MNFALVLAALLWILTGTSFTSSPAQAQVSIKPLRQCWTVFPLSIFEGKPWFEAPSCPAGWMPNCARQAGVCVTQLGEHAAVCREWQCVRGPVDITKGPPVIKPPREEFPRPPFPCEPFKCPFPW
jgi:hypothetical protein